MLTVAVKTERVVVRSMDRAVWGTAELTRQTKESHWPICSESPTNIIRFPRSFSSTAAGSNLRDTNG